MFLHYKRHLKAYAQSNRKASTQSEGLVWNCILKGDRLGYRFLRQKPISGYILDFYCQKLKLGIELDGISHESTGEYDENRDYELKKLGIKIVRYHDNDVLHNLDGVALDIATTVEEREIELKSNPPPFRPSPFK